MLERGLAARTLELIDIPSESRDEARLADHVLRCCVAARTWSTSATRACSRARRARPPVLLAGHLDTVPGQDNIPGRIATASACTGSAPAT